MVHSETEVKDLAKLIGIQQLFARPEHEFEPLLIKQKVMPRAQNVKKKPKKAKLNLEFVMDASDGKKIGWFALKDFPSFYSASIVDVKFHPTAGMKNQTYVLEGLKDSTYQAQQICKSGHMLRASIEQVKIQG